MRLLFAKLKEVHRRWLYLAAVLFGPALHAQVTYPVESKLTVTPPYSLFLSDYATPGRVNATLTLNDPQKTGYKIKVRLVMKSPDQNVLIKTKQGAELTYENGLNFGSPVVLTIPEIQQLFDIQNLDVSPASIVGNGGRLPEGLYFINLEVLDGRIGTPGTMSEIKVSNVNLGAQLAWLKLNDPPFLNFPANNKTITPLEPQSIAFQWTPRHIQSLNSGFDTRYIFRLIEVAPNQNPFQAFLSTSSPLYEVKDIQYPFYNFTQVSFQLEEGKQYAWQVQATTEGGKEVFKNEGMSEVFTFFYTSPCPTPVLPKITEGPSHAQVAWSDPILPNPLTKNGISSYLLMYRPAGTASAWQLKPIDITGKTSPYSLSLDMLEPGKYYDIQLKTVCKTNESEKVYAGSARNNLATPCTEGPKQLNIQNDPANKGKKILAWEKVEGATGYRVKKEDNGAWTNLETEPLTATQYTLSVFPIKIRIDAVCDNTDKPGIVYLVTSETEGHHGPCLAPVPLNFKTSELGEDGKLSVEWDTESVYQSYQFKYRPRGGSEASWKTIDTTAVPVIIPGNDGATYEYTIRFRCEPTVSAVTDPAYFQVQKHQTITKDPTTGDCFPPAHTAYEVTDKTTCDLIWDKISGASGYEVAYTLTGTDNWQMVSASKPKLTLENLVPNKKYQYKVRAICEDGQSSIYSDTVGFDTGKPQPYSDKCEKIATFDTVMTDRETIVLHWPFVTGYKSYVVLFHDVNEDITNWHTHNVTKQASAPGDTATIGGLKPGKTYEFQLQAYCGTDKSPKSLVKEFSTRKAPALTTDEDFECGKESVIELPGPCDHDPAEGSIFHAADFDIRVDAITSAGVGNGVMMLPYMNNALVKVEFKGVRLDANEIMCSGRAWVTSVKLNAIGFDNAEKVKGFVSDAYKLMDDIDKNIDQIDSYVTQAEDAYGKIQDGLQTVKDKIAELKKAIADYKAAQKDKNTTPAQKKSLADRIKALTGDLDNLMKKAGDAIANAGTAILEGAGKMVDFVKLVLTNLKTVQVGNFGRLNVGLNFSIGDLTKWSKSYQDDLDKTAIGENEIGQFTEPLLTSEGLGDQDGQEGVSQEELNVIKASPKIGTVTKVMEEAAYLAANAKAIEEMGKRVERFLTTDFAALVKDVQGDLLNLGEAVVKDAVQGKLSDATKKRIQDFIVDKVFK